MALEELMDAELGLGRLPVAELERLVGEFPLRERLRGQLMTALYRGGRQADALAAYRHGREALMDELGLEPSPALRQLENEILRHELPVTTEPRRVPLARPLAEVREDLLVGRRDEFSRARAALAATWPCVVLVEGPAGIGKTRLAAELAVDAHRAGCTVLYGRAEAGPRSPTSRSSRRCAITRHTTAGSRRGGSSPSLRRSRTSFPNCAAVFRRAASRRRTGGCSLASQR